MYITTLVLFAAVTTCRRAPLNVWLVAGKYIFASTKNENHCIAAWWYLS